MPLVFVHGLGCASSCDYPAVARRAALAGLRVVLLDLPGYGFSDKPASSGYGIAAHAAEPAKIGP
jgi:pimeloyl-ACP methyl ester carboxylesterase